MENITTFLPLDLTIQMESFGSFHRAPDEFHWNEKYEIERTAGLVTEVVKIKAITWTDAFNILLIEAARELDFHELYVMQEAWTYKLICRRHLHSSNAEELAKDKENIVYTLLELLGKL